MNRRILAIVGVVLVVAGILTMSSLFIVDQTEQALVLQLGEVRRVIREPGLKMKRPFIENVVYYDKRVLDFEPPPEEVIVSDQKRLVVDTYTRYRITNPLQFYQTAGNEAGMRARLPRLVSGSLRRVLGSVTLERYPVGEARRDHAANPRRSRRRGQTVRHQRGRRAVAPRRPAGGEQPGDLRPHEVGA